MKQAAGAVIAVGITAWGSLAARAQDSASIHAPDLSMDLASRPSQPATEGITPPPKPARPMFGEAHSMWWTLGAGIANNLDDATDFNIRGAYSYFLVKDVEFSAELNAWYFHQEGPDAQGINPTIVFRWHFYDDGKWTAFGDVGVGLLFADDNVPAGGTSFDFTPRVGAGITRELDPDSGARLQVGLRWHHISNARIDGASSNPSRDGVMLYAGIQFPF